MIMYKLTSYLKTENKCRIEASEIETKIEKLKRILCEINDIKGNIENDITEEKRRLEILKKRYKPYFC